MSLLPRKKLPLLKSGVIVFCVLFIVSCGIFVFAPPGEMYFPAIVPDATENALGALNFVREGRFGFHLNHAYYPERYPLWLPLTFFSPWILLCGGSLTAGVYGVWTAVITIFVCILIAGKRMDTPAAGLLVLPLLLFQPEFVRLSNAAMSEIPYTALTCVLMILLLNAVRRRTLSAGLLLASGVIAAWTGALRPTGYPMLLPFLVLVFLREKEWRKRIFLWGSLCLPSLAVIAVNLFYNHAVFGSMFRTGYHYWCPVPYDFPGLPFQFQFWRRGIHFFVISRAALILCLSLLCGGIYSWLFFSRKKSGGLIRGSQYKIWLSCFLFGLLQEIIVSGLYVFYCGTVARYFLCANTLLLTSCAGSIFGTLRLLNTGRRHGRILTLSGTVLSVFMLAGVFLFAHKEAVPVTYTEVEFLKFCDEVLPPDGVLITNFNPALTELYFVEKHPGRRQIPYSRELEFAAKPVSFESVRGTMPVPAKDDDHMDALKAFPARKVILPLPVVIRETSPLILQKNGGQVWNIPNLTKEKVFLTNLALWQIPEKERREFFRRTRLQKVASKGPMEIFRLLPVP